MRKFPRGWKEIDTFLGCPVVVPSKRGTKKRCFWDTPAYTAKKVIYYESESLWRKDHGLRAHEKTHILQECVVGTRVFDVTYYIFNRLVGYRCNPYEVTAYVVHYLYRAWRNWF